jgi:signal transduction histidine kinase
MGTEARLVERPAPARCRATCRDLKFSRDRLDIEGVSVQRHMTEDVRHVPIDATVGDVARLLADHTISCAVVMDGDRPVGVLSERDVVRMCAADPAGWSARPVRDTVTRALVVVEPQTSVDDAIAECRRHGIRRLPVVSDTGSLRGIVTQTDLLRAADARLREYARDLERIVGERTAQLEDSERRRNDLVDLTVHDIKNWVHTASSALGVLELEPDSVQAMIPIIRHSTRSITTLVTMLLDVNRLEGGWMPLRLNDVPWSAICAPLIEDASAMAHAKNLKIVASGEMRVIVRCDQQLVERVLLNLLDNAVSAAPPATTIDLHTEVRADGTLVARVGNRGPVIPRALLPNIFKKHEQGADRLRGWGLGLTFCRLAVEHHGGAIRAMSPYVDGEGAAFEFTLPREPVARYTATPMRPPTLPQSTVAALTAAS